MSQANVLATFASHSLPTAWNAGAAAAGITAWPEDEDVFSPLAEPYPNCRLYILDEGPAHLENATLVQVSLRFLLADLDEWKGSKFRAAFHKALGFSATSQHSNRAFLPAFDYEVSDSNPPAAGNFKLEQVGSRFWRLAWDGPGVRLYIVQLNLYNQGA